MFEEIRCPKCKAQVIKRRNKLVCTRNHSYQYKNHVALLWNTQMETNKKSIQAITNELAFTNKLRHDLDEQNRHNTEAQEFLTRDKKTTYGAKKFVDKQLQTIKPLLPPLKNLKILNIGAGYGNEAEYFLKWGANNIVLTDISFNFLQVASKRISPRYSFVANAEKLPLQNKSFDIAIFGAALHHIPHPMKALKEAARVAHAVAALSEPHDMRFLHKLLQIINWNTEYGNLPTHRFNIRRIDQTLKKQGFTTKFVTNNIWFPLAHNKKMSNNKYIVDFYFFLLSILDKTIGQFGHNLTFYSSHKNAPKICKVKI